MKIYTKTGDKGETSLLSGKRVSKNHPRISAYGDLDSLNSNLGMILSFLEYHKESGLNKETQDNINAQTKVLKRCQIELFNQGSHIACDKASFRTKIPTLNFELVEDLENQIDKMSSQLPTLNNFIIPGGHLAASQCHVARTKTRECERVIVQLKEYSENHVDSDLALDTDLTASFILFLNRFSDYLFTLARYINFLSNIEDTPWQNS